MANEVSEILGIKLALDWGGSDGKEPSKGPAGKLTQGGSDNKGPSKGKAPKLRHKGSDEKKPTECGTIKLKFRGYDGKTPSHGQTPKLEQKNSQNRKPRTSAPSAALAAWSSAERAKSASSEMDKEAIRGIIGALKGLGGKIKGLARSKEKSWQTFKARARGKWKSRVPPSQRAAPGAQAATPATIASRTPMGKAKEWWKKRTGTQKALIGAGAGAVGTKLVD
jgi:hypothetical protein